MISKSKRPPATNTPTVTMKSINSKLLNADNQRIRWDQSSRQLAAEYRAAHPQTADPCAFSALHRRGLDIVNCAGFWHPLIRGDPPPRSKVAKVV